MEKLVSIVIPTHFRANILERAIKSALKQTYNNIEVIVVSDGFDLETDMIMNALCATDGRVKYYVYENAQGANHARNVGIENSSGEYVAFLDDDDEWLPEKIQKQVAIIEKDDKIGLVCTGMYSIYDDNENDACIFIPDPDYDSSKKILIKNCIGSTTTAMVRKEIFDISGKFDENLGAMQDYDLWIRICQCAKVGLVAEPCVKYYNAVSNKQISQYTERYAKATGYLKEKYKELFSSLTEEERNERFYGFSFSLVKKAIRNGEKKLARKYIKESRQYKKSRWTWLYWLATFFPAKFLFKIRSIKRKKDYKREKNDCNSR